jgi:hypothetical protein
MRREWKCFSARTECAGSHETEGELRLPAEEPVEPCDVPSARNPEVPAAVVPASDA